MAHMAHMAKWVGILHHICESHEFPENYIFEHCEHGSIDRDWLEPTSS